MNFLKKKSYWQQDIKKAEYAGALIKGLGIVGGIAYLFYRSGWAVIFLIPLFFWYLKEWNEQSIRKKQEEFQIQFKDALQNLSAALNLGYSVENAMKETLKDLKLLYHGNSRIIQEFTYMVHQLNINVTAEQVLLEFATRVRQEDVQNFVTVFVTAKRSGGDMLAILKNTGTQICGKIEVKKEIQTMMSAKRLEFQVMTAIPFGILLYMRLSFPEFMGMLYGNALGAGIMTVCLLVYLMAYEMGKQIVEIEV